MLLCASCCCWWWLPRRSSHLAVRLSANFDYSAALLLYVTVPDPSLVYAAAAAAAHASASRMVSALDTVKAPPSSRLSTLTTCTQQQHTAAHSSTPQSMTASIIFRLSCWGRMSSRTSWQHVETCLLKWLTPPARCPTTHLAEALYCPRPTAEPPALSPFSLIAYHFAAHRELPTLPKINS